MPVTISKDRLKELLEAKKKLAPTATVSSVIHSPSESSPSESPVPNVLTEHVPEGDSEKIGGIDRYGNQIWYNEKQQEFIRISSELKHCVLLGAAGTGKTTCTRGAIGALIQSGKAGIYKSDGHRYLSGNTPGIVACSFTRRAVSNLQRALPADIHGNCITIHKLLEYKPVFYEIIDPNTGEPKRTMRFEPNRNAGYPLSSSIHTIIIDESSMCGTDLFEKIVDACPHNPQFIFVGDIQQLPPVFGPAILGFKMLELPVIELTEVYRQALESPIIRLAHRILSGKAIQFEEFHEWKIPGQLTLHAWKKDLSPDTACLTAAKFLTEAMKHNQYDPINDMILIPFNKEFGTIEINNHIANFIAKKNDAMVYEVIAGFNKHYLHVGEKVLYDREDAIITNIAYNYAYTGRRPQEPSKHLDYWGARQDLLSEVEKQNQKNAHHSNPNIEEEVDDFLDKYAAIAVGKSVDERKNLASHEITVKLVNSDEEYTLSTSAEVNSLLKGYALTVHKAQGSEWRKVFVLLHASHNKMLQRELLYTAVTRAREELYVICEKNSFIKGIENQKIKGNTLEEKAEYFKGKYKAEMNGEAN